MIFSQSDSDVTFQKVQKALCMGQIHFHICIFGVMEPESGHLKAYMEEQHLEQMDPSRLKAGLIQDDSEYRSLGEIKCTE